MTSLRVTQFLNVAQMYWNVALRTQVVQFSIDLLNTPITKGKMEAEQADLLTFLIAGRTKTIEIYRIFPIVYLEGLGTGTGTDTATVGDSGCLCYIIPLINTRYEW